MRKNATRRALIMSLLSLLLCASMLVGTTFAWFTDSVTSGMNKIMAGNLDIELEYKNDVQTTYAPVTERTNIFKEDTLWEPGHVEVVQLKISNEGTLALKYQLGINIVSETGSVNVSNEEFKLSDYILFGITDTAPATREEAVAAVSSTAKQIKEGTTIPGTMEAGAAAKELTLVVYMPETVGNEANYKLGENVPEILLGLNLFATQLTVEEDSFGPDYDGVTLVSNAAELKSAVEAGGSVVVASDIEILDSTSTIANGVKTDLYLNGKTISATTTIFDKNGDNKIDSADNYNVFLVSQGGTLNIYGDGEINVVHTAQNMEWNAMTTIAHAYGDVNVSEGAVLKNFGGTDMAFALNVYSGGNITVNDSFLGATYCAMRAFNAQAGVGSVVDVKNSSLISFDWTRAFWAQYTEPLTVNGVLTKAEADAAGNTIYGSVRHAGLSSNALWVGGTAGGEYPAYVANAADLAVALEAGDDVVLASDIDAGSVDNLIVIPNGASATLDLNGHDISATLYSADQPTAIFTLGVGSKLTVNGNGDVHAVACKSDNKVSAIFNNIGGDLVINGGNYTMDYGTYAEGYLIPTIVDTNSNLGAATTTITGGTFEHTRNMFRNFAQPRNAAAPATLIIKGGTFSGKADDFAAIWNQAPNASCVTGDGIVKLLGGTFNYVQVDNDFADNSCIEIASGISVPVYND